MRRLIGLIALLAMVGGCEGKSKEPAADYPPPASTEPKKFSAYEISEVVPLVDGGAYAFDSLGAGLWYVHGASAVRVEEAPLDQLATANPPANTDPKVLWAMLQRERRLRKKAEGRASEAEREIESIRQAEEDARDDARAEGYSPY